MSDIAFSLGTDAAGLGTGLSAAQAAMRSAAARMQGALAPVQTSFGQLSAALGRFNGLLAGVATAGFVVGLKNAVSEMAKLDDAAESTGASVEELSSLLNTLAPSGVSLDTITTAMSRLTKAMSNADDETKGAGEAFKLLGIETRDASGHLRPAQDVLEEVARKLDTYRDGSDKTAYAMAIFGKQGAALLPMLKDLATTQRQAATVTTEQAAESERLEKEFGRIAQQTKILWQELASNLVPTLADVIQRFNAASSAGANFYNALRLGFEPEAELARLEGDVERLQKRLAELREIEKKPGAAVYNAGDLDEIPTVVKQLAEAKKQLDAANPVRAFQRRLEQDARFGSGYGPAPDKPPPPRLSGDQGAEGRALAKRGQEALEQADQQLAKEQELSQTEQMRLKITTGAYKDLSESVKVRLLMIAEEIDRQKALEATVKAATDAETEDYRAMEQLRQQAVRDIKRQNDELEKSAEQWKDLIDPTRRYMRQLEEIRNLVKLGKLTPDQGTSAEFDVESKRQDEIDSAAKALNPKQQEWIGTFEGAFRRLFDSIKEGSVTVRGVMVGAFEVMGNALSNTVAKMSAEWLAGELFRTSATVGQAAVRTAAETAAAATSVATNAGAASTNIMTSAWEAAAGAFKALAGVPYIGPILAPAAAAAAFGAVAKMAGNVTHSAEGGYDIPAWVNPVTQLHAREMVLPAPEADVIRDMAGGRGASSSTPVTINAIDAKSVQRLLLDNPRALTRALSKAARDGIR